MSGYTLTYRGSMSLNFTDGSMLRPDVLGQLPPKEVQARLGDAFEISGEPGETLTLRNAPPLHRLGERMNGGELIVEGDAGDYAGFQMRRGLIVVRGKAGASPGYRMSAGTIVVEHGPLDHPGLEMRRGTIVCLDDKHPTSLNAAFIETGRFHGGEITILRLLWQHLRQRGIPVDKAIDTAMFLLATGDRFELNKGELWLRLP